MKFKLGDIVKLKDSQHYGIGYIVEIKAKTKVPWNIKVTFFDDDCNIHGYYEERNLEKVLEEERIKKVLDGDEESS